MTSPYLPIGPWPRCTKDRHWQLADYDEQSYDDSLSCCVDSAMDQIVAGRLSREETSIQNPWNSRHSSSGSRLRYHELQRQKCWFSNRISFCMSVWFDLITMKGSLEQLHHNSIIGFNHFISVRRPTSKYLYKFDELLINHKLSVENHYSTSKILIR